MRDAPARDWRAADSGPALSADALFRAAGLRTWAPSPCEGYAPRSPLRRPYPFHARFLGSERVAGTWLDRGRLARGWASELFRFVSRCACGVAARGACGVAARRACGLAARRAFGVARNPRRLSICRRSNAPRGSPWHDFRAGRIRAPTDLTTASRASPPPPPSAPSLSSRRVSRARVR